MTITGRRVCLQRMTADDYELLADWASAVCGAYSSASTDFVSAQDLQDFARQSGHSYLAVVTHEGQLVGVADYAPVTYPGSYEIGVNIGDPARWGGGYGAETLSLLLQYLFHAKNAHRVQGIAGLYNKRSLSLVTSRGFTVEGLLRDYFFLDGEYHDAAVVAILRQDYYALGESTALTPPQDVVPAAEKDEARTFLRNLLASGAQDQLLALLDRPGGCRPAAGPEREGR